MVKLPSQLCGRLELRRDVFEQPPYVALDHGTIVPGEKRSLIEQRKPHPGLIRSLALEELELMDVLAQGFHSSSSPSPSPAAAAFFSDPAEMMLFRSSSISGFWAWTSRSSRRFSMIFSCAFFSSFSFGLKC